MGKTAGVVGLALAGGLAIGLKKSVHEAMEAEVVQKRLAQSFKTAGLNIKPYQKSIEQADKATRKMGFSDEDAKNALGSLIVATHSYKKSRDDLNVAMDIARFKNIDLLQATKMLTMAQAGSQRATKQLGLSVQASTENADKARMAYNAQKDALDKQYESMGKLTDAQEAQKQAALDVIKNNYEGAKAAGQFADKQVTSAKVIDLVKEKLHGQAQAYSETTAGAMARFHAETQELEEQLGKMLLPALTSVTGALATFAATMQEHPKLVKAATIAVGALAAALIAARAAQLAMNLAVLANPYVATAVAIGILTAATIKYRREIRDTVNNGVDYLNHHLWLLITVPIVGWAALAIIEIVKFKNAIVNAGTAITNIPVKAFKTAMDAIHDAVQAVNAGLHAMVRALEKIVDLFKWIVGAAKGVGGALGKIGGALGGAAGAIGKAVGDARAKATAPPGAQGPAGGKGPASISPRLYDELAGAQRFGLVLTSGYRPGAVTKHGTPSDHGIYPSHAIDVAGSASGMGGFFKWLIGQRDVKQAFYDPLGSIFNGVLSSYREGGHSDHVHVATYDQGGWLRPGWNLAYNGLGRPEPVGGGDVIIPVSIGGEQIATVVFDMLRRKAKVFEDRNGRAAFGGA